MGAERLPMRRTRDVLRLKHEGLSHRAIARACGIGMGAVSDYVQRAVRAGLSWPIPEDLDDAALEGRLFSQAAPAADRAMPDLSSIHQELKPTGVTLQLLWEEYREVHPDAGYSY